MSSSNIPGVAPVIIGAGPAGMRAAQALVAAGLRPVVLDEAPRAGGQIYRQPPPGFVRTSRERYGSEAGKADALHRMMQDLLPHIDYRPDTLAWHCESGLLDVVRAGVAGSVPFSHLILATGATDRVLPFEGWTTPGVYTLGGAQVALKYQGCAIGARVAFLGTGPLLYLVAYQYAKAGAKVVAVLDTAGFSDRLREHTHPIVDVVGARGEARGQRIHSVAALIERFQGKLTRARQRGRGTVHVGGFGIKLAEHG